MKPISSFALLKIKIIWWLRYLIEFGFRQETKVVKHEFGDFTGRVIDFGCGVGNFSALFPKALYHGLEVDKNLVDYATQNFKGQFFLGDAQRTDFPNKYFDAALAVALFHHLNDDEVEKVVAEIHRVVKKKAKVVVIEDERPSWKQNLFLHLFYLIDAGGRFRRAQEYERVFASYFRTERVYPIRSGFWRYQVFVMVVL